MDRKTELDRFGVLLLIGISAHFAFNQVVIKWVNDGLQPVFFAGIRSLGAVFCIWVWMIWNGRPLRFEPGTIGAGVLVGLFFGLEFLLLFKAIDETSLIHTAILFNTMPLWLAIAAHFFLPGQHLTRRKAVGLLIAFAGVAWAMSARSDAGQATLRGDLYALGAALGWASTAFMARGSVLKRVLPEMQLFWMVLVSGLMLTAVSPFFGPLIRNWQPVYLVGVLFQIVFVVSAGFILWLWVLATYPPADVAGFGFLTPIFGVVFGWAIMGETIGPSMIAAALLVALGLIMVTRAPTPGAGKSGISGQTAGDR